MLTLLSDPLAAAYKNLRRLFWLRFVIISFLALTAVTLIQIGVPLSTRPIAIVIGLMLLLNLFTWWRLGKTAHVSELELVTQLIGDIATLTALFYLTGGYSNPFVWMYLLPLAVAAVALRSLFVWLIAGLAVACYSLLVFFYIPLSHLHVHAGPGKDMDIHLVGMWLGFVVSAGIFAFFVARIGRGLREYDRMVAEARETALESERMVALGTLATAAAHELGTPLATMAVLSSEMLQEETEQTQLKQNLLLMRKQVDRCKEILTSLTIHAGDARAENAEGIALDVFLAQTIERWHDHHPAVAHTCTLQGSSPVPMIAMDRTLGMAITNLLDNAADASPEKVDIYAEWNGQLLVLNIRDYGKGLSSEMADRVGTPFFSTKRHLDKGMGLGLYLARMILARFDGTVKLDNHAESGTMTCVRLPLEKLKITVLKPHPTSLEARR